jgi:hypothetical protein
VFSPFPQGKGEKKALVLVIYYSLDLQGTLEFGLLGKGIEIGFLPK